MPIWNRSWPGDTGSGARFGMLYAGVEMGEWIRGRLKPAHALALYAGLNRAAAPEAEVDDAAAREYLRKGGDQRLLPVGRFVEGLNRVVCRGVGIGWVKRVGNRYNNLYPAAWRVLRY